MGKGGFGTVYSCLDEENGGFFAIKQVNLGKIPKDQLNSIMVRPLVFSFSIHFAIIGDTLFHVRLHVMILKMNEEVINLNLTARN